MNEAILNQLKEYAMVTADDLAVENPNDDFTEELQAAFTRAMDFSEIICPVCWVKSAESSSLNSSSKSDSFESYHCEKCGFDEELVKTI